jgi:hypothetical protein
VNPEDWIQQAHDSRQASVCRPVGDPRAGGQGRDPRGNGPGSARRLQPKPCGRPGPVQRPAGRRESLHGVWSAGSNTPRDTTKAARTSRHLRADGWEPVPGTSTSSGKLTGQGARRMSARRNRGEQGKSSGVAGSTRGENREARVDAAARGKGLTTGRGKRVGPPSPRSKAAGPGWRASRPEHMGRRWGGRPPPVPAQSPSGYSW